MSEMTPSRHCFWGILPAVQAKKASLAIIDETLPAFPDASKSAMQPR